MQDCLNESINKTLFIELYCCEKFFLNFTNNNRTELFEKYGIKSDIDIYFDELYSYAYNNLMKHRDITITENIFSNIPGNFIDNMSISISFVDRLSGGGTQNIKLGTNNKLSNVDIIIEIDDSAVNIRKELRRCFYHEFNHVYEEYNRLLKNKKSMFSDNDYPNYTTYLNTLNDDNTKGLELIFANMMYIFTCFESHAFITNVHSDLKEYIGEVPCNMDGAINVVKSTKIYSQMRSIYNNICYLKENVEQDKGIFVIERAWLKATGEKKSAVKIIKKLESLFERRWNKFLGIMSHVIHDVFVPRKPVIVDSGKSMNREIEDIRHILDYELKNATK